MKRRNYRPLPTSLPAAFTADKDTAVRGGRSVERLAELEDCSASALYKRIEDANWPVRRLARWFQLTGGKAVIGYLCAQAGGMFVPIPTGKRIGAIEANDLAQALTETGGALMRFYAGHHSIDQTLAQVQTALEGLAYHHENVRRFEQPELELQ